MAIMISALSKPIIDTLVISNNNKNNIKKPKKSINNIINKNKNRL